ncbi:MAG TPA: outer membrane lipoprotein-sorting protein [Bacteroidetes bacterium]|nr:outer membrane lipoprotein-sorting protein [Bacteroidota bacterium]
MISTYKKLIGIAMLGCFAISMNTGGLTAIQILKKAEQKLSSSTVIADVSIVIKRPKWTKTMELKTWSKGMDYAMAYVKGPDKDEGTVYLKAKKDVYNYLPKVKKTVKLPSNLLSQNWMGTDMTTDDLVKLSKLTLEYDADLSGSAQVSGRDCYVITLIPKPEAEVLWGKLVLSIDKKDFIQLKTMFYDEDLELVNTVIGTDIKNLGGKILASKLTMIPAGKTGQSTVITYKTMKFDTPIADAFFSKSNMPKVKP